MHSLCAILFCLESDYLIDCHYDLLTILYCCYLKNDFSYIEKLQKDLKDIDGLIANLYFMSKEEMEEELQIVDINVVEMFKISTNLFKKYFNNKKVIYSIEGCDYIKDSNELEELYNLGLRSILLVWNNENRYGSGNRSAKGLTKLGREFLTKAVDLGMIIDLSHMNKNTFYDAVSLINELKSKGKSCKVIASHSNSYSLCHNNRNLNDEQLLELKNLNGMVGLVSYGPFINENSIDLENSYLEHIKYMENILGIDSIMIATDNMEFATDLYGVDEDISLLSHKTAKNNLTKLLKNYYNEKEIKKILMKNIERLFEEI